MKPIPALTEVDLNRFWSKVDKHGECWEWTASKIRQGYGNLKIRGMVYLAHRLSYFIKYGDDPGENQVCHSCDNPSCVNSDHLWLGTNDDNVQDRQAKNRQVRGEAHKHAKRTEKQVKEILESNESDKVLSEKYQIDHRRISDIRLGRKWKHITGPRRLSRKRKKN